MPDLVSSLNVIDVASPCMADWEAMTGDNRKRHCAQCNLNVYNLSDMAEDDALRLVNENEGRLCVRFFRRQDGTMITRDCPVGLAAVRRKIARMWASAAAVAGTVFFGGIFARSAKAQEIRPEPVRHEVALGLMAPVEFKGDLCVTPQLPVEFFTQGQSPAGVLFMIRTVREKIGCKTIGQPDPKDTSAMSERDRQRIEEKIDDPAWALEAGSREHQLLVRYFGALLQRHPEARGHLPVPKAIRDIAVQGRVMIAPRPVVDDAVRKELEKKLKDLKEGQ